MISTEMRAGRGEIITVPARDMMLHPHNAGARVHGVQGTTTTEANTETIEAIRTHTEVAKGVETMRTPTRELQGPHLQPTKRTAPIEIEHTMPQTAEREYETTLQEETGEVSLHGELHLLHPVHVAKPHRRHHYRLCHEPHPLARIHSSAARKTGVFPVKRIRYLCETPEDPYRLQVEEQKTKRRTPWLL